ncbi:MAG: hypothetical protein ACLUKN_15785 [Bacilli bacterium]
MENINPEDIVYTIYFGFDQYAVGSSERDKVKSAADFFAQNGYKNSSRWAHRLVWYGGIQYCFPTSAAGQFLTIWEI